MTSYYDNDFDLNEFREVFEKELSLIEISKSDTTTSAVNIYDSENISIGTKTFCDDTYATLTEYANTYDFSDTALINGSQQSKSCMDSSSMSKISNGLSHETNINYALEWDAFFSTHNSGNFFKSRNYILNEFHFYFQSLYFLYGEQVLILEIGSGYGCTLLPLLQHYYQHTFNTVSKNISISSNATMETVSDTVAENTKSKENTKLKLPKFIATDYSPIALSILMNNKIVKELLDGYPDSVNILKTEVWDVTKTLPTTSQYLTSSCSIVLAIFAISAIHPSNHIDTFYNISRTMRSGSYLLFRDYAHLDMTMLRHKRRLQKYLFQRTDETLCYYFTKEYIESIINGSLLKDIYEIKEMKYACVKNVNRKKSIEMKRVFLHLVLKKK